MIEKHIVLEDVDPVVFYGVNNVNIQMIKALHPKLRIVARGNVIKVMGDEEEMCAFEEHIIALQKHCAKYNSLKEEDIIDIIKGRKTKDDSTEGVIVYSVNGKPITARSENQLKLVKAYDENDMIFAIGPAGSGKTYTSIALAVRALKNKEIRKIILSRPAVEAGEKLGFLPGDMKEKIDPYLQPLYDALQDMFPPAKLQDFVSAFMITFLKRRLSDTEQSRKLWADFDTAILAALKKNGSMSVAEIIESSGLSRNTVSAHLRRLKNQGVIEGIERPKNPRQRYRLAKEND